MQSTTMRVKLCREAAPAAWGQADVIFNDKGQGPEASIHLISGSDELRQIQKAARKLRSLGIHQVALAGTWSLEQQWRFGQGFYCAKNDFELAWTGDEADVRELTLRAACAGFARDLVNDTPENLSPLVLAHSAAKWLAQLAPDQVSYRVIEGEALLAHGWIGIHAVGRGSERPPALLELDYNPLGADAPVAVALVGKGITFDSGGYSIKPSEGMLTMKCDMGGAATVTAGLGLAISRGLQQRVKLYLCCAENLISGRAYKLGDILTYKNGVSVEVVNTDAEGRLVLADGLQAACESGAKLVIDAATLTGAAVMAVGRSYNAIFSPEPALLLATQQKAAAVDEQVWPLPLAPWHKDMCPSAYADTANSRPMKGGGAGGASNAAGFLWRFVSPNCQWLHMDLAAAFEDSASSLHAAGATAHGVLTVAELLKA
ncbi:aminopeptidase PepB [Shewanella sp. NIFS-20-20]|uniref:aminopeptidase PepB n=1 Tax=Shewanella sp. NIFS-20-20 TaxID=2853806 RepID=UPI001C47EB59|nr:aminopeptidase PepB [Shewanella sp. NIFS-20-20]MBV7314137.1 aminopeptidase PepB [Shewanella sp. NIFS-20-20]